MLTELARRGYVAISPQYRFCPKEIFPAQVHDVKAAVRWLRSNGANTRSTPTTSARWASRPAGTSR